MPDGGISIVSPAGRSRWKGRTKSFLEKAGIESVVRTWSNRMYSYESQ